MFHSDFWKNGSITNEKKQKWKKERENKFQKSFYVDLTSIIQIINYF